MVFLPSLFQAGSGRPELDKKIRGKLLGYPIAIAAVGAEGDGKSAKTSADAFNFLGAQFARARAC
jgi:hypothetical protein